MLQLIEKAPDALAGTERSNPETQPSSKETRSMKDSTSVQQASRLVIRGIRVDDSIANPDEYDVAAIISELREKFGSYTPDEIEYDEFWRIIQRHALLKVTIRSQAGRVVKPGELLIAELCNGDNSPDDIDRSAYLIGVK